MRVAAADGTDLCAYDVDGPGEPFCLANGLGGNLDAWRHVVDHFRPQHRIISWDYRGLYGSGKPVPPQRVAITDQVDDMLRVMDALGVERPVVFGWSMGVQVALELYRRAPDRCRALVLVGGAAGVPLDTAFGALSGRLGIQSLGGFLRPLLSQLHALEPWFGPVQARLAVLAPFAAWLKHTGLFSPQVDEALLRELAGGFLRLDYDVYLATMKALAEHDARDMLETIAVPTLVIVGDRDVMTPPAVSESMASTIPGAELLTVRGGTHYLPIEYPELLNLRVAKFLRQRVFVG